MAKRYSTFYKTNPEKVPTTDKSNAVLKNIDNRLDTVEKHVHHRANPHRLDTRDTGAAKDSRRHRINTNVLLRTTSSVLIPEPCRITKVWATLSAASVSGKVRIDIAKSGDNGNTWVSIFSTKLTIDANKKSSIPASVPAVISKQNLLENDQVKMTVNTYGTGSTGLAVGIVTTRLLMVN